MSSTIADLVVRLNADVGGLTRGMSRASGSVKKAESDIKSSSKGIHAAGAAIGAGLLVGAAAIGAYAIRSIATYKNLGSQLAGTQRLLGGTAEESSRLVGQIQLVQGVTTDTSAAFGFFSKNLGLAQQGSGPAAATFKRLGIDLKDSNGQFRTGVDVIAEFRNKVSAMSNASERAAAAAAVMGRGYKTLLPWLSKSSDDIGVLNDQLKDMGFGMNDADMAKFKKFMMDQRLYAVYQEQLQFKMGQLAAEIEQKLMPTLLKLASWFNKIPTPVLGAVAALAGLLMAAQGIRNIMGIFPGLFVKSAASTAIETAAVTANTAAWDANAVARNIGKGAVPLGAAVPAGGAAAGGLSGLGLAGAIAGPLVAGIVLAEIVGHPQGTAQTKAMQAAGVQNMGRMAGSAPASAMAADRARMTAHLQGLTKLRDLTAQIKRLSPTADNVGAIAAYDKQLAALATQYPELKTQIDAVRDSLKQQGGAFETAAQAAADAAEAIRTAFTSMKDFNAAMLEATIMGKPLPTAAQAAYAAQSDMAAAAAKWKSPTGTQWDRAHPGGNQPHFGYKNGKPVRRAGNPDGRGEGAPVVHVHIANLNGTDEAAARRHAEMLGRHLSRSVMRQLVGQNA